MVCAEIIAAIFFIKPLDYYLRVYFIGQNKHILFTYFLYYTTNKKKGVWKMYKIASHGTKAYGIKSFILDTVEDVNSLPTDVEMGSSAYIIATGDKYLLNSEK